MDERIWHQAYDTTVPRSLTYPEAPLTRMLDDSVARAPDAPAIVFEGKVMSYRELGEAVARFARALADLGVRKGDRVLLYLPNVPHMVVAYYGTLKAGAIAIRSYGGWYVYHPITSTYDICDTTSCQVYGTATASSTNAAVDATAGIYVVDSSGAIARAEYSAENNNSGSCGNCYTINNPNDSICLSDSVCCGTTLNGHGRGMCQWGTQRWATNQGKTYDWITDHYYSAYGWTRRQLTTGAPIITQQPASQAFCPGTTATFTVAASGQGTLSYQWQKGTTNLSNDSHYSGVTTTTLSISAVGTLDVASYTCLVTNTGGTTPSSAASLTLRAMTTITQAPAAQSICPGQSASFTVVATGDGTLTYQWQKDGTPLSDGAQITGSSTTTLTVSPAGSEDLGSYRCVVTGGCGPATSAAAPLSFSGPPYAAADFDQDGDVDQEDFAHLQNCFRGYSDPPTGPDCLNAALNGKEVIDEHDLDIFLGCYSGPDLPADTCCGVK